MSSRLTTVEDLSNAILTSPIRADLLKHLALSLVDAWEDAGYFRSCLNCANWQEGNATQPEGCKLFQQLPPPKVIVTGCEQHTDIVPF